MRVSQPALKLAAYVWLRLMPLFSNRALLRGEYSPLLRRKANMFEVRRSEVSRVKLIHIATLVVSSALCAACIPTANGQISSFVPMKTSSTVSVRDLQIASKARDEFERGLRRLLKRDAAGSLKHFDAAIQKSPGYYEVYYHRGVAEMQLDKNEEALESFQRAIDLSEGRYSRAQFGYGLILCRQGKPEEAELIVRRGLETNPNIADGHVVLGFVLLKLNRTEEAEKSAREALRLNDSNSEKGYLVLADVDAARGDYQAQVRDLNTYLKFRPNDGKKEFLRAARDVAKRLAARAAGDPAARRPAVEAQYHPMN
jgi:tetratricopeptide (TPR) repeat protein